MKTVLLISMLVLSIRADYQFEIRLLSYVNPRGLDAEMMCCEPEAMIDGNCIPQATCDTQFYIRLQNFHRVASIGNSFVLGTFDDTNSITFPNCGTIKNVQLPLVVTFPRNQFNPGETIRVFFDIVDVDIDPQTLGRTTFPISINTFAELPRIQGTNSEFSDIETIGGPILADLTITFQYRLICTAGFCGNDCSQTTNCPGFPEACPPGCSAENPCPNGGTCESGTCMTTTPPVTTPPTATPPTTTPPMTTTPTTTSADDTTTDPLSDTMMTGPVTAASQGTTPTDQSTTIEATTTREPTTREPAMTTREPATTTGEPATTTGEPATTTGEPATTTGEPATTTGEPATTTGEPAMTTGELATTTGEPAMTTRESTTTVATVTTPTNQSTTIPADDIGFLETLTNTPPKFNSSGRCTLHHFVMWALAVSSYTAISQ